MVAAAAFSLDIADDSPLVLERRGAARDGSFHRLAFRYNQLSQFKNYLFVILLVFLVIISSSLDLVLDNFERN